MSETKVFNVPDGNNSIDPALIMALSQNGGFGNGGNWMWMMFMWILFPWIFNGNGFGNGFGNSNGTGFLANQLNNDAGRDLLLQAINGRADALTQLGTILNTDINSIQQAINVVQSAIQTVGAQVGLTSQQVINSVQAGNATLSQQLCECCCENRLAIANQTSTLQSQAAANASAAQLQLANHDASVRLQLAQQEAADQLAVCQQTNQLGSQADRNTNTVLDAIASQNVMITKEFCDLKERELQNKIDSLTAQNTLLRSNIDNAQQTAAITGYINSQIAPLQTQVNTIANKQPNTVPVEWPNLTAVNNTPYGGGFFGNGWFGNGWGGSFWG